MIVKPLCVVDTCSLIYLSEIELARRPLHRWLWAEFSVRYSRAVWDEIRRHMTKMGKDAKAIKRNGENYIVNLSTAVTLERALFAPPFLRNTQVGQCKICKRPIFGYREFSPDLASEQDRGERHNCCISLDIVMRGDYRQVIFLTDDQRAITNYVAPVLETFPLGNLWLSHDFVLYLFMRHRNRIARDDAKAAIRDVNAKAAGSGFSGGSTKAQQEWTQRLKDYHGKVDRVDQVLSQFGGY